MSGKVISSHHSKVARCETTAKVRLGVLCSVPVKISAVDQKSKTNIYFLIQFVVHPQVEFFHSYLFDFEAPSDDDGGRNGFAAKTLTPPPPLMPLVANSGGGRRGVPSAVSRSRTRKERKKEGSYLGSYQLPRLTDCAKL